MDSTMQRAVDWMRRRAENVVACLLGIMFVAFLIQIVFRYFFNFPIGWSSELSVVTWLYMVLIGSAFWLKETEEVRFDLISSSLGPLGRRVLGLIVAVAHGYVRRTVANVSTIFGYWAVAGLKPVPGMTLETSKSPRLAFAIPILAGTMVTLWLR